MLVTPNFDEVQDEVGPGTYKVIIKKGEVKKWREDDPTSIYVNWELETTGEQDMKNNGRRIFHKTSAAGRGAFMLQQFYRAATGTVLNGPFDTEQLIGKQLAVEVVDGVNRQTKEPTGYTEVKRVKPLHS
jgi:hypothetical protein